MIEDPPNQGLVISGDGRFTVHWINWIASAYRILQANVQSGTTAQRPTKNLWTGRRYFDTTLGKPIWHNGTNWVDATGATV